MTNPFLSTTGFYVNPDSQAARWVRATASNPTPDRWRIKTKVADQPTALWVGPGDPSWVDGYLSAAAARKQLPVLVAYAIPHRDLGQHSSGGAEDGDAYLRWVLALARTIGPRPAVVILEPDTLIHMPGLPEARRFERAALLSTAVNAFRRAAPEAWVYLDGGDGRWNSPESLAPWLLRSGVVGARGFAVNVSNYNVTAQCLVHAQRLQDLLSEAGVDGAGFVIDTSRNGNGAHDSGDWCNPPGRRLGAAPVVINSYGADALLWIKAPGESDGDCGIGKGIPSGRFSPALALSLIKGT